MHCKRIFILKIFVFILIFNGNTLKIEANEKHVQKRGVMDGFGEGLKYAGQMFGINTAADVATLVAKAFSATTNRSKPDFMSIFQQRQQQSTSGEQEEPEGYASERQQQQPEEQQQQATQQSSNDNTLPPAKEAVNVDFGTATIITNVLKMIGFDASKLGALAINAIIMIAQAIGNTLMATTKRHNVVQTVDGGRLHTDKFATGPEELYEQNDAHQPRSLRDGTPIDWFLQNPSKDMKSLLNDVTDKDLSNKLTGMIEKLEIENGQGACLKMLMCKSTPFIWGMQKSLAKRFHKNGHGLDAEQKATATERENDNEEEESETNTLNVQGFFKHLPSLAEYREYGEQCEQRYANQCNTTTIVHNKFKKA